MRYTHLSQDEREPSQQLRSNGFSTIAVSRMFKGSRSRWVISAMLFDLDGTLIDTDDLQLNGDNQLLARRDRSMHVDYYKARVMGFPDHMIFGELFPDSCRTQHAVLAAEKRSVVSRPAG